ncbi:hypothetical protein JCM9279_001982 [Rhodotorula babjevae]
MLGSLLGSLAGVVSSSTSSTAPSSSSSTAAPTPADSPPAPSTPAAPANTSSTSTSAPAPPATPAPAEDDPFSRSAYFQRLLKRGAHKDDRIADIKEAALRDGPPREPGPEECCNEACALDCVVTMWWEEEKTWRDMHPDWKSIRRRLKEEEEDRRREAEEEAALNGEELPNSDEDERGAAARRRVARGKPSVQIAVEKEEGPSVEKVGRRIDELAF